MIPVVSEISVCWLISFSNGRKLGFTDFDLDIMILDTVYKACGGRATDIGYSSGADYSEKGIFAILDNVADDFIYDDIRFAIVDIMIFNRVTSECKTLVKGRVSEVIREGDSVRLEISSLLSESAQIPIKKYSKICRAELYDSQCCVVKDDFKFESSIKNVTKDRIAFELYDRPDDTSEESGFQYYEEGFIQFVNGENINFEYPVDSIINGVIFLKFCTIKRINPGEDILLFPGCDKNFTTCIKKFHNHVNFRGEPYAIDDLPSSNG